MKIVFAAVPYLETDQPIMAPAVLKAVAESQGHKSFGIDLNIDFRTKILSLPENSRFAMIDFLLRKQTKLSDRIFVLFAEIVDQYSRRILSYKPNVVGLSLLTWQSQVFAQELAINLKRLRPKLEIIMGGTGITQQLMNSDTSYCWHLKNKGIIDHYITGDGEQALVEYLNGNLNFPGIDSSSWTELSDLDSWPVPDYSDYDFSMYQGNDGKVRIPIADSRGCVRTCEFCDIIEYWKKYRYRSADSLWHEMLQQINKHNISDFIFHNALTNGNMKVFGQLLDRIVEYNSDLPREKQISWVGYFIVRNSAQHPEELWQKLSQSNANLMLGVESAIQRVRYEIGKKFTNEDIDWHLDMGQKYQVPLLLLIIVAYPTETVEDFEFTKQWFRDRAGYAQNSVVGISLQYSSILPNTALARKSNDYGIVLGNAAPIWFNKKLSVTVEEKIQHMQDLLDICEVFHTTTISAVMKSNKRLFDKDSKLLAESSRPLEE
jgi:hypothetical protein